MQTADCYERAGSRSGPDKPALGRPTILNLGIRLCTYMYVRGKIGSMLCIASCISGHNSTFWAHRDHGWHPRFRGWENPAH